MAEKDQEKPLPPFKLRDAAVIGFGLTLAVLIVGGVLGYFSAGRLAQDKEWVAHTHEVIGALETLLSTLQDAETGQRGYLLTEDEKYLEPYDDALRGVQAKIDHLKELTSDNPDQQARLAVLDKKIDLRLDLLKQTVALMKKKDRPAALKIVHTDAGKARMDDVRKDIAAMQQAEEKLLKKRAEDSEASYRTTIISILLPAVIGVLLVGVVFYLSQRSTRRRHRAAAVLAEQKERLRTTLASIGDAVISTDAGGNVTYLNTEAESLTGWKNGESAGAPLTQVFNIVNESTRRPVENPAFRALKEGVVVGLANHTVLIAKDGTERPIDDSAAPIRDGAGTITGMVLVFRDISERRRSEETLRQSEERSRRILEFHEAVMENMGEGLYAVDTQGLVTYMNPAAERLFGWKSAELQGGKMHDLTHYKHPDDKPFPIEECAGLRVLHDGKVLKDHDDVFIRKDGGFFPVVVSSSPLVSEGKVAGLVVVFRDVTERKEAQELLRVQATRDFLTGLWNRAAILDLLERELNRGRREETAVSLAFIDLDNFKRINDAYGHQAGDAVLRAAGDKMRAMMRPYDLAGRYGGEEFLIVLPGCDEENLRKLCERLRGLLAETSIEYEKQTISWTVSVGAAMANPTTKTEADALLRAADLALYRAKTGGRNRVELAAD